MSFKSSLVCRNTSECIGGEGEEWLFGFRIFFPIEMTAMPARKRKDKGYGCCFLYLQQPTLHFEFMRALHTKQKQNVHICLDIKFRKINLSGLFSVGIWPQMHTLLSETAVQSQRMEHDVTLVFDTPSTTPPNCAQSLLGLLWG